MSIRIKICCIESVEEAQLAVSFGASALGFVSDMPSGPGVIAESKIAEIISTVPPGVSTFLLSSRRRAGELIDQQKHTRAGVIQICDVLEPQEYLTLRRALPGIGLVQVIHITGPESVDEAVAVAPLVDALLLDSGNPNAAIKELGGTGRVHDWSISLRIRASLGKAVYLAGGLRPENAVEAIGRVAPFGLDVCTGVRTDGRLDARKLRNFMNAVAKSDPGSQIGEKER